MDAVPNDFPPQLFRHAVESAFGAILITAPDSGEGEPPIVYVNPSFERLTGYSRGEAIGKAPRMLFGPETDGEVMRRLGRTLDAPFERETVLYGKDGSAYHAVLRVSPVQADAGEVRHWIVVQHDVTERNRHIEELEGRVQERTRELEGFLYTVSHDFRAPLRAIMSASMILLEDYGDAIDRDGQAELKRQSAAAKKMGQLMDDILRLSRLTRQEMRTEPLDLSLLVRDVAAEVAARASGEKPSIEVQDGLKADGDTALVRLMVQNLLENSIKFAKTDGPARIAVGQTDGAFYLRDEGIGFPPEKAEKIFGPFERLHTEAEYPGTGVGLANVKRVVDRHDGRVWAEGRPGEGATFWFTLG